MFLKFKLFDIQHIEIQIGEENNKKSYELILEQKTENNFLFSMPDNENLFVHTPYTTLVTFICSKCLCQTEATIDDFYKKNGRIYVSIKNPETLEASHNREYYRVLAEYDCIYTVETENGVLSFNAVTYDLSLGGISIITTENIIPARETCVIICLPGRDIKTNVRFCRCEALEDGYKLSFTFTDVLEKDLATLEEICKKEA